MKAKSKIEPGRPEFMIGTRGPSIVGPHDLRSALPLGSSKNPPRAPQYTFDRADSSPSGLSAVCAQRVVRPF